MTRIIRRSTPAILFAAVLFVGCAGERTDAEYDAEGTQTDIEAVNERFETYVAAQQWDSLMTLYTDDAIMMPQGAPMAEGNAIRDGFMQMGEMGVTGVDLETVEIETAGNTAYEVGRYVLQGPNGLEIDHGKYLVVWKNVDGEWKLHRDMFNTDQAAAPPGDAMPSDTTSADTLSMDTTAVR